MVNDRDTKTYIIVCEEGDVYCGKTNNIDRRMKEHLKEKNPNFFSFKGRKPFYLYLVFNNDYEKEIKRFGVKKFLTSYVDLDSNYIEFPKKYGVSLS